MTNNLIFSKIKTEPVFPQTLLRSFRRRPGQRQDAGGVRADLRGGGMQRDEILLPAAGPGPLGGKYAVTAGIFLPRFTNS